jgi:hypothetical protein
MQVNTVHRNDALTRHRERLRDAADKERARADELSEQGNSNIAQSEEKKTASAENQKKGESLKRESDRLRRNGREQSLRGLNRLADGSDRYAESFEKQETGLANLQGSLDSIKEANDTKSGALEKIDVGLTEQTAQNNSQSGTIDRLEASHNQGRALTQQKGSDASALSENNTNRGSQLNTQTERVGDFILAGDDFEQGAGTKKAGVQDLSGAVGHRVQAEAYNDLKSESELKQTWSEVDAERHQKADKRLFFDSLFESLRAKAADANAAIHHHAAQRGEMKAEDLQQMADSLKAHADACLQNARTLEYSGQHHVCVGQQMKCCPWTYCQGVALERQGYAEIARAQEMKHHARSMRNDAQAKALEAETARVKAEQAREVGNEYQVKGHGSALRSEILKERSDDHELSAEEAVAQAQEARAKAQQMGEAAAGQMEQATALNESGQAKFQEGLTEQRTALGKQAGAVSGFQQSVGTEGELQNGASEYVSRISRNLSSGRSVLGRNRTLLQELQSSVSEEKGSQQKVQTGIDDFRSGRTQSAESTENGRQAAQLLEQARDLELEGLRLQNRGQKMLLEARPKMANAARLSAESFDAFKKSDSQEEEAERLIAQGTQKLSAAVILRQKAAAYESVANDS